MNKQKDTCTHFEENKQKNKKTKQKKKRLGTRLVTKQEGKTENVILSKFPASEYQFILNSFLTRNISLSIKEEITPGKNIQL